ncbi:unnamed protein product [Closterium sp. NIES-53]
MTLRPSTAPQRVPLPSPLASSLPVGPDPESDYLRAASPSITRFLATAVTDPLFESTAASALVTELVDFAAACRLDHATSLVAESASVSVCPPSVGGECALSTDVLEDSSSSEAEIYAGAMAAQELRWLTYLLTDLGEAPRSPPVLYVDNKAMLALCQEHRLEHRTKHIALRYFLARELQQRCQLRLAYVASQANTADVFTKALQPCDHQPCFVFLDWSCDLLFSPTLPMGFGFLPGSSLAEAVSLVADAINAAKQEDEDWLLLLVDFQKAYDSVSREHLFTTLGNMGFSRKFTGWVKGLHDGAATKVMLNDWIGEHVEMVKGVTIINSYAMLILLFHAQIYAPPHDIWTKVKRLCHNFLSGGKALLDRHFTLWSYELSCRGRKEGGLGVIDLKHRIDSIVIQNLGKALAEQEPLRNWIWERVACFPLGLATIYAHPLVLKHWLGGGARWKAAVKALWDSKIVVIDDPARR